jgi:hypothetical protein
VNGKTSLQPEAEIVQPEQVASERTPAAPGDRVGGLASRQDQDEALKHASKAMEAKLSFPTGENH